MGAEVEAKKMKACRFPECTFSIEQGKKGAAKRHRRRAHLPWFAMVPLRRNDFDELNGLAEMWRTFLIAVSMAIIGSSDLHALLEHVRREKLYPVFRTQNVIAEEDLRLVRWLDSQLFREWPATYSQSPPSCMAALIAVPVLMCILDTCTPQQRSTLASFGSEDRQHVEGRWPKPASGVVPPADVDTVVEAPTASTSRQVTEGRAGLKVQIDVGPKSTGASREPERLNLADTHFHFDRMVRGRHDWSMGMPPSNILDHNARPGCHMRYAVTSFCDPEAYPDATTLQHLRSDDRLLITVGVHPKKVDMLNDRRWNQLQSLLRRPDVVGLGEIGLDYTSQQATPQQQRRTLEQLMRLELRKDQVIVLHLRGTRTKPFGVYEDFLWLARHHLPLGTKLHFHSFTGNAAFLHNIMVAGFPSILLGVNSMASRGHLPRETQEVIYNAYAPRVVMESDAPYLGYGVSLNFPHSVYHTAVHLSAMWQKDVHEVVKKTLATFRQFYQV